MDVKKIGIIAGGFIASFLAVAAAVFFLYPYLNPESAEAVAEAQESVTEVKAGFDPNKYGPKAVEALNQQVVNLQEVVDSLRLNEDRYSVTIDSLEIQLKQAVQADVESKQEVKTPKEKSLTAEDLDNVSKSLLNLDEESLAPIVNLLEDRQLVNLYNAASSMQRSKLLRSLQPEKAANILKKVMS